MFHELADPISSCVPFLSFPATEWFDQWTGYGVVGEPSLLYPSAETLEGAKRECLLERPACVAVLETRSGFYLLSSKDEASPKADSVLHVWSSKFLIGPPGRAEGGAPSKRNLLRNCAE